MGEAISKLTIIVTAEIFEDGMYHPFVQSTCSSFAVQAFVIAKGVSFCSTDSSFAQVSRLAGIDW